MILKIIKELNNNFQRVKEDNLIIFLMTEISIMIN
jgi:hypothetical protein